MTKSAVGAGMLVETWVFREGKWVRADEWMSDEQLQGYADEIRSEQLILMKRRGRPEP